MDEDGVRPDAVQRAHQENHLSAIYVQPAIQNPLTMTMPSARRADLVRVVQQLDLPVIEDNVYAFLDDEPPLSSLAPDPCIALDNLSKKVGPGLTLGFIVPPKRLRETVMHRYDPADGLRQGLLSPRRTIDGRRHCGRTHKIEADRRANALEAGGRAAFRLPNSDQSKVLSSLDDTAAALAVAELRCAAARRDIALTPSTTFAATPGHAPNAVRLALGGPTMEYLDVGLSTLAAMLSGEEHGFDSTE